MQGRRLFVIIICSFILASVGTTIFAWTVVGGVRDNARVASAQLRLVTNAITAYTETFGAFPFSSIELGASQSESARAELDIALAIRALGLGSTLTTRHLRFEKETEAALGLPPNVHSYAILPIGWPMGKFGPTGRGKLSDFVYLDNWGEAYPAVSEG